MSIAPGTYRIRNAKSGTVLDLSRKEGNEIHGWQQHDQKNQQWYVQRKGDGYVFKNVESGQFASVGSKSNGSKLHGSGNATTWNMRQDDHEWFVSADDSKYVIDLDMGRSDNGSTIHLWEKTGAKQQKWSFDKISDNTGGGSGGGGGGGGGGGYQQPPPQQHNQPPPQQQQPPPQQQLPPQQPPQQKPQEPQQPPQQTGPVPPGTYTLKNVKTGTVLDLSRGESNEGADVFGYDHNGGNNQKWLLQPTGQGQNMTLRNLESNSYLGFPGQDFAQGVLVKGTNSQGQQFIITGADKGFYVSPTQQPGYVLDLVHGSDKNGTKVCVWQNNQQDNQKWYFERA